MDSAQALMRSGPPFVQGVTITHMFDPTAIPGELIFCHHVFKFTPVKLSKSPILGDVDHLASRELELSPTECFNHMLRILQLGMDGHSNLTNVDPGHCALGLSKGTSHTCLEPKLGWSHRQLVSLGRMRVSTGKGCLLRATHIGHKLNTLQRR